MIHRAAQLVLIWFGVLGFLVQSLTGGIPAGQVLCIGCEGGSGWAISDPCTPESGVNCCSEADHAIADDDSAAPMIGGLAECDCSDVPLISGAAAIVLSSAGDSSLGEIANAVPLLHEVYGVSLVADSMRPSFSARAGPCIPARGLNPRSRCTVLVI